MLIPALDISALCLCPWCNLEETAWVEDDNRNATAEQSKEIGFKFKF